MPDEAKTGGQCDTCLQRRSPYPCNLPNSDSGNWNFWSSGSSDKECGGKQKQDECGQEDACKKLTQGASGEKKDGKATEFKQPSGKCPPMPSSQVPALCKPAWLSCPAKVTVPPYPAPKGVEIRPISEGGRGNKCEGGKCSKCGVEKPVGCGIPRVSPTCPMMKPRCLTAKVAQATEAAEKAGAGGLLAKITSLFNFGGGKDKDKK